MKLYFRHYCLAFIFSFIFSQCFSQIPGFINRQATSIAGRQVLDPNGDGYSSLNNTGFTSDDVGTSEIAYKVVRSYSIEPYGDLRRGPDHKFTDFVPDAGDDGFYYYFNGTQVLYRFRLGSIMSGSKGYSVMLDTDGKFGATGANADPNYQAATTGNNGNPGFEIEIVLETNFRIAIYNVDGTSSPTLIKSYSNWQEMSQFSISATNDNGDPDFFMDFYIPFSDLQAAPFNLTAASSIRMTSTTVMSPQAAIGGPKSDIYGVNDDLYPNTNKEYEDFIDGQPPFTLSDLSGPGAMCTTAPTVNLPISTGVVNISGTWVKSSLPEALSTATITVYKNGNPIGTVNGVTSGIPWTLNNIAIINGDIITAKAQAAGESMCLTSNAVTASSCNSTNISSIVGAAFICNTSRRGFSGIRVSNASVKIYVMAAGGIPTLYATDGVPVSPSGFNITYSDATHWEYNGANNSGGPDPCSGGPNDIPNGYYFFTNTEPVKCESVPIFGACVNLTATATPTVTQTTLYNSTTIVSGTAVANSTVRLYTNGVLTASTTAAAVGGAYTFSNLSFSNNDVVVIIAQAAGNCVSTAVSKTVVCFTNPPIILADGNNQITGNLPITGTSGDGVGTVIRVYSTPATLVATTTVQANGTWSTANVGTLPATYNAVAATSYYATAQNGSCGVSQASATYIAAGATSTGRCGSISGTPIGSGAVSISGTLTGSFATTTVNLYLDGVLIGTTNTINSAWGPIAVNTTVTNTLYPNGILTIGVQESGKQEAACAASAATIVCSTTPAAALISPVDTTIVTNETVTYTISNAVIGTFYALADSATGSSLGEGKWATANGNLQLITDPYLIIGIYKVAVKATSLSGITTCISPEAIGAVTVDDIILPLSLISFSGRKTERNVLLEWSTENEYEMSKFEIESSYDAIHFELAGQCAAKGNNSKTLYFFKDDKFYNKDVFYRLKMINSDGTFKYSKIIIIKSENTGVISKIYPNPFVDKIQVEVIADNAQQTFADLIDNTGRVLFTKTSHINAGPNIILFDKLDKLSKGVYIISIKINNTIIKHRILKIK